MTPATTMPARAGDRSFHMKAFASLLAAVHSSNRAFSPPTSIAVQTKTSRASAEAASPASSIDVPCAWVDFPSGLKR